MRDVRLVLLLSDAEVDGDEFVGNVALFGYLSHAARGCRYVKSVKLEWHDERGGRLPFGCGHLAPSQRYLYLRVQCCMYMDQHSFYLLAHHTSNCDDFGLGLRQTLTEFTYRT